MYLDWHSPKRLSANPFATAIFELHRNFESWSSMNMKAHSNNPFSKNGLLISSEITHAVACCTLPSHWTWHCCLARYLNLPAVLLHSANTHMLSLFYCSNWFWRALIHQQLLSHKFSHCHARQVSGWIVCMHEIFHQFVSINKWKPQCWVSTHEPDVLD